MEELNTTQIILTAKLVEVTEQIVRLQNRAQELKEQIEEAKNIKETNNYEK